MVRFVTFEEFETQTQKVDVVRSNIITTYKTNLKPILTRLADYINKQYPELLHLSDMYVAGLDRKTKSTQIQIGYPLNLGHAEPGNMTGLIVPTIVARTRSLAHSAYAPMGHVHFPMGHLLAMAGGDQEGGAPYQVDPQTHSARLSKFYKDSVGNLMSALGGQGKVLDTASVGSINRRLDTFTNSAKEFAEDYNTVREYVEINARVRDQNINVDIHDMKKYNDRFRHVTDRFIKSEVNVIEVIRKLQNLMKDEERTTNTYYD